VKNCPAVELRLFIMESISRMGLEPAKEALRVLNNFPGQKPIFEVERNAARGKLYHVCGWQSRTVADDTSPSIKVQVNQI
jgi:hypothetical protein